MYNALGLSGVIFIIHAVSLHGFAEANRRMSLGWMAAMALLNLIGAAAYTARASLDAEPETISDSDQIPEKLHPGHFDLYGSSHQILHFTVVFAGLAHAFGLLRAYRYHHDLFQGLALKDVTD